MSPLRLRGSLLLLPLLLPLLLGGCLPAAAGRNEGAGGGVAASARAPAGGSSGRFRGPERHTCSRQLSVPAPGPAGGSELAPRCRGPAGARPPCAYRGPPERCAASAARRSLHWRQVLGGLRRRRRPCRDPAPLGARPCAGGKGRGAELRLLPRAAPPARPTAAGSPGEAGARAGSRGRPREPALGLAARAPPRPSAPPKRKSPKKAKGSEGEGAAAAGRERASGAGPDPDGLRENSKLTETYCAEKWRSFCDFFVNFWNG